MKLAVVIPAFNEEQTIASVVASIPAHLDGIRETLVLVVDDGSTDTTGETARRAGARVVAHSANRGVGAAFQTGIREALALDADIVVNVDADGQFDADDIPRLMQPVLSGQADFVTADRFHYEDGRKRKPENMPPLKYWGNTQVSKLINMITGHDLSDVSCGFRAYSRDTLLRLNVLSRYTYTQETFLDLATKDLRIASIPVTVHYFTERRSRVVDSTARYALRIATIMVRTFRDHQPLRFFGWLGALIFAAGLACDAFTLWHYAETGRFTPFKSIALAGIYLNTLGIVVWLIGLMADMLDRVRVNQEQMLYLLKRDDAERRRAASRKSTC